MYLLVVPLLSTPLFIGFEGSFFFPPVVEPDLRSLPFLKRLLPPSVGLFLNFLLRPHVAFSTFFSVSTISILLVLASLCFLLPVSRSAVSRDPSLPDSFPA